MMKINSLIPKLRIHSANSILNGKLSHFNRVSCTSLNHCSSKFFKTNIQTPNQFRSIKVLIDLCVIPIGVGTSLSSYVAECEKVLKDANVKTRLHSYGTNIEGEWEDVFAAVKKCHEVVHAKGAPRIATMIKLGTRIDKEADMDRKIESVLEKLKEE